MYRLLAIKPAKYAGLIIISIIFGALNIQAQSHFKLYKSEGHFYFNGQMNETRVDSILLETGCGYIMCNEAFFNEISKTAAFEPDSVEFAHAKSYRKEYAVKSVHRGRINVGDLYYEGKIIVLEGFNHLLLPIHLLRSNDDTQDMLIRLNFGKLTMDFISSNEIDLSNKNSFEIVELQPRPVIEVPIDIVDEKGTTGKMTARLNFDLGCANYVSLFGHSQKVANWIKDTQFRMITTYQSNGRKSGKGILANSCSIGELYARNIPVNILNWSVNDMDGLIGPSFFGKKNVYLCPSKRLIYY